MRSRPRTQMTLVIPRTDSLRERSAANWSHMRVDARHTVLATRMIHVSPTSLSRDGCRHVSLRPRPDSPDDASAEPVRMSARWEAIHAPTIRASKDEHAPAMTTKGRLPRSISSGCQYKALVLLGYASVSVQRHDPRGHVCHVNNSAKTTFRSTTSRLCV